MAKIVTLGEIMLRLSTEGYLRFTQADRFDIHFGGGEANVAISLANYGHKAYFVTKLPEHAIGESCIRYLSQRGVDTSYISRGGKRIGIYYLETGVSMRPSNVIYDRFGSSISEALIEDFDWDNIFKDAHWFHITGITPALGELGTKLTEFALIKAKSLGITTSVDLNYRKKLWTPEQAQKTMIPLMKYVDVCIGNEEDASLVLGVKPKTSNVTKGDILADEYHILLEELLQKFSFKYVATSLRTSFSATKNGWQGLLYDGKNHYLSQSYTIDPIVDRVGGGDAFASGLIHGLLTKDKQEAIEFAVAASALKHTIIGDANDVSENEVKVLMKGDQSGRVQR
jgi:2-dehydro-3-deoxygluconokinase